MSTGSFPEAGHREYLGKEVRKVWVDWAKHQDNPKPQWGFDYADLTEADKEVDNQIGVKLFGLGMALRRRVILSTLHWIATIYAVTIMIINLISKSGWSNHTSVAVQCGFMAGFLATYFIIRFSFREVFDAPDVNNPQSKEDDTGCF